MKKIRLFLHYIKKAIKIRWIKSAYINLRLLPFRQAIKFPFIVMGKLKIRSLKGNVTLNCKPQFGLVNIGYDIDGMPIALTPAQLFIKGNLILNGDVIINQGANLVVWPHGTMTLGNDVMICSGVLLKAINKVTVGVLSMDLILGMLLITSVVELSILIRNIEGTISVVSDSFLVIAVCIMTYVAFERITGIKILNYLRRRE